MTHGFRKSYFRTQLAGLAAEDSMAKMDHDFVKALKVGMPPVEVLESELTSGDAVNEQPCY